MSYRVARSVVLLIAAALLSIPTLAQTNHKEKTVIYDHIHRTVTPGGPVALAKGDTLIILVTNTNAATCFTYPITVEQKAAATNNESFRGGLQYDTISLPNTYDGTATGYKLDIKFQSGLSTDLRDQCKQDLRLDEDSVTIPVQPLTWALGFAGAFTADTLTDPVYFLEPGTKKINNVDTPGFTVHQNSGGKDTASLGTAAMVHLQHTDPDRWPILGGNWAPISFGLGVGADSKTKYYFGTSLRFDEHLYLTGGVAFGPVKRLPNDLTLSEAHSFTTSATALDNLPTRNRAGFFISVSYSFLGRNFGGPTGPFASAFNTTTPATTKPQEGGQAANKAATLTLNPVSGKAGDTVKVTPKSGTFGDPAETSTIKFGDKDPQKSTTLGDKWKANEITVNVPIIPPGDFNVVVKTADKTFNAPFKVTPALKIDPPAGKVGTKITITPPAGTDFGGIADKSSVKFNDTIIKSKTIADNWTKDAIKNLSVPQLQAGKVKVTVIKDDVEVGSTEFEVQP